MQVVYAQYGGLPADTAGVMVVCRQWFRRDGTVTEGGTTVDVRLPGCDASGAGVASSVTQRREDAMSTTASVGRVDTKLEVVTIPVSDVDRAKEFYRRLGWRLDDTPPGVVQFTPPGSGCSVQFGENRTSAAPGSAERLFLIVSDIEAARDELVAAGVEVSDIFHPGEDGPAGGPDPEHRSYFSLASFSDPDGNGWLLQEVTTRLPGRIDSGTTTFASAGDLASALRRAEAAHGEHEKRLGEADANWPGWYADYMVREQAGAEPPS